MKVLKLSIQAFFILVPIFVFSQIGTDKNQQKIDTTNYYYIIKGDSIPREFIDLEEVILLNKLQFTSKEDRRRYFILRRKTRKVYPYAKLASERLITMSERLKIIKRKRDKKKYTKRIQKIIRRGIVFRPSVGGPADRRSPLRFTTTFIVFSRLGQSIKTIC